MKLLEGLLSKKNHSLSHVRRMFSAMPDAVSLGNADLHALVDGTIDSRKE